MSDNVLEAAAEEVEEMFERDSSGAGTFVGGLVFGLAIGAAVGMLFAPASGDVTRRRLRRKAEDLRDRAEDELEDLERQARRKVAKIRG